MVNALRAFSLIELLVVLAIVSILVSLSFPAYQKYRIRTHRIDAQAHLMSIAMRLEEYRRIHHSYADVSLSTLGFPMSYPAEESAYYQLKLQVESDAWLLSAVPIEGLSQQGDGDLVLNYAGQRCWQAGQSCIPDAVTRW